MVYLVGESDRDVSLAGIITMGWLVHVQLDLFLRGHVRNGLGLLRPRHSNINNGTVSTKRAWLVAAKAF